MTIRDDDEVTQLRAEVERLTVRERELGEMLEEEIRFSRTATDAAVNRMKERDTLTAEVKRLSAREAELEELLDRSLMRTKVVTSLASRLELVEPVVAAAKEWHEHGGDGKLIINRLRYAVEALLEAEAASGE